MLYRLVAPVKRKGSANHQFVQRIPADVKARVVSLKLELPLGLDTVPLTITPKADAIRVSLRTAMPSEVKARTGQITAYLETVWAALRSDYPVPLTHRQVVALAGELYRAWADGERVRTIAIEVSRDGPAKRLPDAGLDDPGPWEAMRGKLDALAKEDDTDAMERTVGPVADRLLARRGILRLDPSSRRMVLQAFIEALRDAMASRARNADGDYSPDPNASRFPEWVAPLAFQDVSAKSDRKEALSLTGLVEDWWKEAKSSGRTLSTFESYRNTMARFTTFLGHDDATAITDKDVVRFKDHRLSQGVSPKTVGDSDIAGLRSIFTWAVGNLKLPANPAERVRVTRPKVTRTRSKDFTTQEATAILSHSLHHQRGGEKAKTAAAKRWVPWLCAYTGARLGEMVQLRKRDVRHEGGDWIITITPEAGTVKDKEAREVLLHEHLIAGGFAEFVKACPDGYLFLTATEGDDIRGVWRGVKNRLRDFAREVVTDKGVAPNHGWRHLFKTIGREAGIADSVLDGICGHSPSSVGGSYGGVTLKAQREAFAKFPRFEVA